MPDRNLIYFAAREPPPAERPAYLATACEGDPALRARVEQMLAVADKAEAFITERVDAEAGDRMPGRERAETREVEPAEMPDEAIGQKLGRYKLLERIGEGGCGVVYVAEQTEPVRRRVALKLIKPGMDSKQVVARFEAERQALAMMDHPNIAKVLDAGTTETVVGQASRLPPGRPAQDLSNTGETPARTGETPVPLLRAGRPYFVMELVRGTKITDYCDQNELSTQDRLDLFIKVCQAI